MPMQYPIKLNLAQTPTPLQLLSRYSQRFGNTRIWVKRDDLTGAATSGNKIRKLEFTLAEAQQQGCDTLITCGGLQSNHCRSTALLGAQLGLKVHLILRGPMETQSDGNLLLDQISGAKISVYNAKFYAKNLSKLLQQWQQHYAQQQRKAMIIPTGASDGIGVWGYVAAAQELKSDFHQHQLQPQHIVFATGSGGTQAGLTAGNALHDLNCKVWGVNVCDDETYFQHKVKQDLIDWQQRYVDLLPTDFDINSLDINILDGHVGPGYAKAEPEVFATISELAQTEGVILDPVYSGKAFLGMVKEIQHGKLAGAKDIIFIHTGGLFGLYAQKQQLSEHLTTLEMTQG